MHTFYTVFRINLDSQIGERKRAKPLSPNAVRLGNRIWWNVDKTSGARGDLPNPS